MAFLAKLIIILYSSSSPSVSCTTSLYDVRPVETYRVVKLPMSIVQLDRQTRLPFPRLFQHRSGKAMMIVP